MAYLATSASDWRDLLAVIAAFASGEGWTIAYDAIATKGQLGLSKGNCFCAMGSQRNSANTADANTANRTDAVFGGTIPDAWLAMTLATSLNPANDKYWLHPGSLATRWDQAGGSVWVLGNDLVGPFPNVWLFGDAAQTYIHVVVQCSAERYTHIVFGNSDVKGLNQPSCGYLFGSYFEFWPNYGGGPPSSGFYNANDPGDGVHSFGLNGEAGTLNLMVPAGVLNATYGWTEVAPFCTRSMVDMMERGSQPSSQYGSGAGALMDGFYWVTNAPVTGGVPLFPVEIIFRGANGLDQYLGEVPDLRLARIEPGMNPGQELTYAEDTWMIFPWKQQGEIANAQGGTAPTYSPNSTVYGIALKKIV